MGTSKTSLVRRPEYASAEAAANVGMLRALLERTDLARYEAQLHEQDMVKMLAGFAYDFTLPVDFRRGCMNDVLDRARGKPMTTTRSIMEAVAPQNAGTTEIDAARASVALMRTYQELLVRGTPRAEWPAEVRQAFPDGEAAYAASEG